MSAGRHLVGVDVGTGSARAGVFGADGALLAHATRDIRMWREDGGIVEQSSDDIWRAVCAAVRAAMAESGVPAEAVAGIGFDATCSMVVVDADGAPLPVGPSEDAQRNVIVWMDHRATPQAERINAGGHDVLRYVGGRISPEMQTPKLLWLRENRPAIFARAGHFLDLPDYLSWRATGSLSRSLCTVVCKWTYLGHERRWDADYFRAIGLGELADEGFSRIGPEIGDVGAALGAGLTAEAAADLGLAPGTAVGGSLIDAHAGGLGSLGWAGSDVSTQLALIAGTSSCTMSVTREPTYVDGVWGPYFGAMIPGYWLTEGGQSGFGASLDHVVAMHPAAPAVHMQAQAAGLSLPAQLERMAIARAGSIEAAARLGSGIHVVPEFLGNRSPEPDPDATAIIAGLRLETSADSLVDLFVATVRGLAYGTAAIVDTLVAAGQPLDTILVSGGAARSALLRRILAAATGRTVAVPAAPEPVLLGAAMLGAVASGVHASLGNAASAMVGSPSASIDPDPAAVDFHAAGRRAYRALQLCERALRREAEPTA
jgi:D-ribulokinase